MKKLLFTLLLVIFSHSLHALIIQQVSISPTTGSNINLHLKVVDGYMFIFHDYSYTVENNTITLTVCYDPILIPSVTTLENDFILENINFGTENYSLVIITNYRRLVDGQMICDSVIFSDTETFYFSAPLTETVTLSSHDFQNNIGPNFILFPNPTNGSLEFKNNEATINEIKIYDNFGRLVKIFDSISNKVLDLKNLENGMYLIEFNTENGKIRKKILLEK